MKQPTTVAELRRQMRMCEQTPGMSVLQHGVQVARYFDDLYQHVMHGRALAYDWRLPDWVYAPVLWQQLPALATMRRYQIYHDCGKPWSREVDEDGRVHFPNHAQLSAELWLALGQSSQEAWLMRHDMDVHLLKDEGVAAFASQPGAAALLLTGLAEIHANAAMFGGIDSMSFKIKHKHISRRGRAIVAQLQTTSTPSQKDVYYA